MHIEKKSTFSFIDLFAGIGGFRLALDHLGGHCIHFSEIDNEAIQTYCSNFNESPSLNLHDITQIKQLPSVDLLTAGVPCQSWSIAGKNLGFDDDRGQLWNDTLYLLHQSQPKAFIFENVKGLADPRNHTALDYILKRIQQAGYFAKYFVINSSDYGVPQDRVRVYIVGFKEKQYSDRFQLLKPYKNQLKLIDVLQEDVKYTIPYKQNQASIALDLFGQPIENKRRYRKTQGMNDFFLFNDIRNGPTTIHSWDLLPTTERQKNICLLILKNRRKSTYGKLDGNPMSLAHLQALDHSITQQELDSLVEIGILKTLNYTYQVQLKSQSALDAVELLILNHAEHNLISLDNLKNSPTLKKIRSQLDALLNGLVSKAILTPYEKRYEFKYTKISTGIEGVNRVFLPKSEAFPTLVASDTNDFIALQDIEADTEEEYKKLFLQEIFHKKQFRKISKQEACLIQGFPKDFILPETRSRWMKLIGNSVSVPVIQMLAQAMLNTGFLEYEQNTKRCAA
ncbi:MAG: DNA (cytosine-5-)-methyltransferase [Thiofilum sp.]|uniref:DNA (cytosine-5-)-methyltransferase n=1 Tax=Thiofilum sp. TaxID=2212733 RepID=UPI0026004938|nr:DNA (cytosine-5-)-methyltransferase [Thiofilum sp.]MBK8454223.1 DNA (cytosine-5-)-methyltransferase [Thiofilum sp.]